MSRQFDMMSRDIQAKQDADPKPRERNVGDQVVCFDVAADNRVTHGTISQKCDDEPRYQVLTTNRDYIMVKSHDFLSLDQLLKLVNGDTV